MNKSNFVKIVTVLLMSCGGLGLVGGGFFLSQAFDKSEEKQIVKDIQRYKDIRYQLWSNTTQIQHFPAEIPSDATDIKLVYSPASPQGGSVFQVRFKQPQQKIEKSLAKYKAAAKYKYKGGNVNDHANQPNGVPTTFFYTNDDASDDAFPASYDVLVLGAQDQGQKEFKWNHGSSYGVAISPSASEIVYWAEAW